MVEEKIGDYRQNGGRGDWGLQTGWWKRRLGITDRMVEEEIGDYRQDGGRGDCGLQTGWGEEIGDTDRMVKEEIGIIDRGRIEV
ncbi:hypothetical protein Pmani_027340 [Petrolisthes manimaculis]|uniref:Uncharacterized protein n=1 Tax=Petrolisthes manimaculis TaxID=1843537 RepID=A0AAE1TZ63_9EUCA|nr:hypothetical protein Pmani_027340 [Petrolisthes manimaculis]